MPQACGIMERLRDNENAVLINPAELILFTAMAIDGQAHHKEIWLAYEVNSVADGPTGGCKLVAAADPYTHENLAFVPSQAFSYAACKRLKAELQRWIKPGDAASFEVQTENVVWTEATPDVPIFPDRLAE